LPEIPVKTSALIQGKPARRLTNSRKALLSLAQALGFFMDVTVPSRKIFRWLWLIVHVTETGKSLSKEAIPDYFAFRGYTRKYSPRFLAIYIGLEPIHCGSWSLCIFCPFPRIILILLSGGTFMCPISIARDAAPATIQLEKTLKLYCAMNAGT